VEPISSHAEHALKCLKVEYLGRIEHNFQKSRVTGPWYHMVSVSAKKVKKKFHACVPLTVFFCTKNAHFEIQKQIDKK
jgi:hypothetical protein